VATVRRVVRAGADMTYEHQATHHVQGGAQAAEEDDLVCGYHVLSTRLHPSQPLLRAFPTPDINAPSPMSSGRRASGIRVGSAERGSRA
jgi:hypothetical protein